jgi:hypothetical protein
MVPAEETAADFRQGSGLQGQPARSPAWRKPIQEGVSTMFRRKRVPPPSMPIDMITGGFDAATTRQLETDDEAQRLFEKISPLVNTALEYIRTGKAHNLKHWDATYRPKSKHAKSYGQTLISVHADEDEVDVNLFGYCHFNELLEKVKSFYGMAGLGFTIEGNSNYDHEKKEWIRDRYYITIKA